MVALGRGGFDLGEGPFSGVYSVLIVAMKLVGKLALEGRVVQDQNVVAAVPGVEVEVCS